MREDGDDREATATAGAGDVSAETRDGPSTNGGSPRASSPGDVSPETRGAGASVTPGDVSAETRGDVSPETPGGTASADTPATVPDGYTRVATLDQLPEGTLFGVEVDGHRICLANVEGEIYALQDNCSHQDFPLSAGCLEDGRVECAWHGAKFDPASGRAVALPAIRPVKTFDVRVDGDLILVDLG